jgi:hypothetical protein
MKESEKYKTLASKEDNDLKVMGLLNKALRERRNEKFEDYWLLKISEKYLIETRNNGSHSIFTEKYDIVDYFPKANKLLIRKDNKWIKPGLQWILKNLDIDIS